MCYHLPSTSDVRSVTLAALRLPAGNARPILSSLSRKNFPPFLDFALKLKDTLFETFLNFQYNTSKYFIHNSIEHNNERFLWYYAYIFMGLCYFIPFS